MSRVFILRLALLGLAAAWLPGPASAQQQTGPTFDCARASGEVEALICATFYQETDPPSVVITYGDDQVIAFQAPAASGAKYTASNVEFWEHQGEASVSWYGTVLTCRPRAAAPAGSVALAR